MSAERTDQTHARRSARRHEVSAAHDVGQVPVPRRIRRRLFVRVLGGMCLLALLPFAAATLVALYLSVQPIDAVFVRDRVVAALREQTGSDFDVNVDNALIRRANSGLAVELSGVSVRDRARREVVRADSARVLFDSWSLVSARLVPRRVLLRGAELHLDIQGDGQVLLSASHRTRPDTAGQESAEQPDHAQTRFDDTMALLAAFGRFDGIAGALASVELSDGRLVIRDSRSGLRADYEDLAITFTDSRAEPPRLTASARSAQGPVSASLEMSADAASGQQIRIGIDNLSSAELALAVGLRELREQLSGAFALSATVSVNGAGALAAADVGIRSDRGNLVMQDVVPDVFRHDLAALDLRWVAGSRRVEVSRLAWQAGETKLLFAGDVTIPDEADAPLQLALSGRDLPLDRIAPGDPIVRVDVATAVARIDRNYRRIVLDRLAATGQDTDIAVSGEARLEDDGPSLKLKVAAGRMPARTALRYWPISSAPEARSYLLQNVASGTLDRASLAIDMPPPVLREAMKKRPVPAEAVHLDFAMSSAAVNVMDGLPPLAEAAFSGTVTGRVLDIAMPAGELVLRSGRKLSVVEGSMAVADLGQKPAEARVAFRLQGSAAAAAEVMTLPVFKGAVQIPADPADIKGNFDGRVTLSLPLVEHLDPTEVATQLTASISALSIDKAFGKERLENGALTLTADRSGVSMKGEARIGGLPVSLETRRPKAGSAPATTLSFVLDDATRTKRGLPAPPQLVGPVAVKLVTENASSDRFEGSVEIDLSRAAIDGLLPGFQKPAGRPARATFDIEARGNATTIGDLTFEGGGASIKGAAELAADGSVSSVRLSMFRLSPGDNVRVDYERGGAVPKLAIRGNNLDARPFLKKLMSGGGSPAVAGRDRDREKDKDDLPRDLDLDVRTTLLSGFNGEVLTGFELKAQRRSGTQRQHSMSGKLSGARVAAQSVGRDGDGITLETGDAGALLRFLDLYPRLIGGQGTLEIGADQMGAILVEGFSLRNEPAIRQLVASAPVEGQNDAAFQQQFNDVAFTKLRVEFAKGPNRIEIKDAAIWGPQIGIVLSGIVDMARDRLTIGGTFVPAYGLNNAFAQVPILGGLLSGGRNEGLLGVTFGISGKVSQPTLTVRPLSAIAPGIFRKLFEFSTDRTPALPNRTLNDSNR